MGRRIADMEMRLTEQARVLADRERERDQLRVDVDSARRIEADLRQELGTIERRHGTATEALRAEKTLAESQLERAREDRAKLQREAFRDEARGGSDLGLRAGRERAAARAHQRCGGGSRAPDLGARRARLDDRHDPCRARACAGHQRRPASRRSQPANTNGEDGKGSLADRIRALQARSSRLSSAT